MACVAFGCKNRNGKTYQDRGVTFHRFPINDPERLQRWVGNINRIDWAPTKFSRLCSVHFTSDSFDKLGQKTRLQSDAVPTIFSPNMRDKKRKFSDSEKGSEEHNSDFEMVGKKPLPGKSQKTSHSASVGHHTVKSQKQKSTSNASPTSLSKDSMVPNDDIYENYLDVPQRKTKRDGSSQVVSIQDVKKTLADSLENIKKKLNPDISTANLDKKDHFDANIDIKEENTYDIEASPQANQRINGQDTVTKLPNNCIHFKFANPKKEVVLKLNPKVLESTKIQSQTIEDLVTSLGERRLLTSDAQELINGLGALPKGLLRITEKTNVCSPYALKFTEEIKRFATILFLSSPEAYDIVCTIFKLPDKSDIQARLQVKDYWPGFTQEALTLLKRKALEAPNGNVCTIMFDFVHVKRHHTFDKLNQRWLGHVDLTCGREPYSVDEIHLATEVLLFTAVSLKEDWKIPFGYFFNKGLSGELLKNFVQEAVFVLEKQCGMDVKALVCNGSASTVKMGKLFGCNIHARTFSEVIPSFPHPFDEKRKMYLIFALRHSLNLLIYLLKDKSCLRSSLYGVIDWKFFNQMFGDAESKTFKVFSATTPDHIKFCDLQRALKLCRPGFSSTLSSALELAEELQLKDFCECQGTSCFAADIHRAFDLLNSRKHISSDDRPPIHLNTMQEQVESLMDVAERLFTLELMTGERVVKEARWMSVLLFSFTLKSVSYLAADLITNRKLEYFSTNRVNLDHLDMVLSSFQRCGNWKGMPSPSEFQNSYKSILKRYTKDTFGTFGNYDFEGKDLTIGQGEIYTYGSHNGRCFYINNDDNHFHHILDLRTEEVNRAKNVIRQVSKRLVCPQCVGMMLEEDFSGNYKAKQVIINEIRPSRFLMKLLKVSKSLLNAKKIEMNFIENEHFVTQVCHEFLDVGILDLPNSAVCHMMEDPYHITSLIKVVIRSYITLRICNSKGQKHFEWMQS